MGAASSTVTGDTVSMASVESGVPYQILDQSQEETLISTHADGLDDVSDKDLTLRGQCLSFCFYCNEFFPAETLLY